MSIFADEWRECLREQYKTVVRGVASQTDTRRNLDTLETVMYEVGFTEAELRDLQRLATLRAEDLPDDYVPPEILAPAVVVAAEPEPVVEMVTVEAAQEPEAEPLTYDDHLAEQEPDPEADEPLLPPPDDDKDADTDSPQQLSLF